MRNTGITADTGDGDRLVQALLDPAAWPHPVRELKLLETHISWVILTGDFAYKIKKPVKLEFLDFSTLALRQKWCREELRLNSRWAPQLYLDVVAITGSAEAPAAGGTGTPIEYAVKMRQFEQSALLSEQLQADLLDEADMRQLAEMIADRHGAAPPNRDPRFGDPGAIRKPMDENFFYLEPCLAPGELAEFRAWTESELDRNELFLESRRRNGFIRRCHGDLHLRNLVRIGDEIVAFDCVEFSEELRTLDVISDLTFLSMDLVAAAREDLAWVLLNRYLEVSGDYAGMQLYGLYHVYHCMIRAKVAAILASERDDAKRRAADLETMQHYCDVARQWIEGTRPALVVMHGLSGSGKTWLSTQLLGPLNAVRIRSDIERKRIFGLAERASSASEPGQGLYGAEASAATYEQLFALARNLLSAGHRVILDAAFLRRDERSDARRLAAECNVPFALVAVAAPDSTLGQRIEARQSGGADASEADLAVLDFQRDRADPIDDEQEGPVIHFTCLDDADTGRLVDALKRIIAGH